jgi:hypothetical protein
MPAEALAYRPTPVDQRKGENARETSQLTEARRAGLEALEREFNAYLKAQRS